MRIGDSLFLLRQPFRFVGADKLGIEMSVVDTELFRVKVQDKLQMLSASEAAIKDSV